MFLLGNRAQMVGVEIGQRQMANFAGLAQIGEIFQCIEVSRVAVIPPMELH
jgi:hypothetical protein